MKTDVEQMLEDLKNGESRQVEFKQWLDVTKGEGQLKIVRSIAALSNSGGGRLYFGVDDKGKPLPPDAQFPLEMFTNEIIRVGLRRHVGELECQVLHTTLNGVSYPVVHVPRHGEVPWVAPDAHGRMGIFIRSIKPETITPTEREQWDELLANLMQVREQRTVRRLEDGIVARTQEMAKLVAAEVRDVIEGYSPSPALQRPDWDLISILANDTRAEFVRQLSELQIDGDPTDSTDARQLIAAMATNNVVDGYALLSNSEEFVRVDDLQRKLKQASRTMRTVSYDAWSDFLTFTDPKVSPKSRFWEIAGRQITGVEGMHHNQRSIFHNSLDYWRAYANGVFTTCKSFDEDIPDNNSTPKRYLAINMVLLRTHSVLAHSGIMSKLVPGVDKLALFSEPAGIKNRMLRIGDRGDYQVLGFGVNSDRYPFQLCITADELFQDYFGTLAKVLNTLIGPYADRLDQNYFNAEVVEQYFENLNRRMVAIRPLTTNLD